MEGLKSKTVGAACCFFSSRFENVCKPIFSPNGQLIIEDGATLELGDNVLISGQNATNKIIVEGTLCGIGGSFNNPVPINNLHLVSLYGTSWGGIEFNNPNLTVKLNGGLVSRCIISGELASFEASSSTAFSNSPISLNQSGLKVNGCSFANSNILVRNNNSSVILAQILYSTFQNSTADAIIRIEHCPQYLIQNCTIYYDHGTGIDLYYSGSSSNQYSIKGNTIQKSGSSVDLSWGIKVYHTFADIENNFITNNRYGVATLNNSQVRLIGNSTATSNSETQQIFNNYQNQVRASDNSFPYYFHNNIIKNTPSGTTFLVYYDPPYVLEPPELDNLYNFNLLCNCFDNFNPINQLYPLNCYQFSTWCPTSTCVFDDSGYEDFEVAMTSMDSSDYSTAESQFKSIISNYPGTGYARESAKKLLPLTILSNGSFVGLKNYYDSTENLHLDSLTDRLVKRLKTWCDVERKAYPDAITWYENDILNPYSYNDSIYSIIDLEDTYMLAATDSTLKSVSTGFTGQLVQYKPKSKVEYIKDKERLISLLFIEVEGKDTKHILPGDLTGQFVLYQNKPNPFSSETEVSFYLPEQCNVNIAVFNMLGQRVMTIPVTRMESGKHSKKINLKSKPDGAYVISLIVNENEVSRIKCIKYH